MRYVWWCIYCAALSLIALSSLGCSGAAAVARAHEKSERSYCYSYRGIYGTVQLAATGIKHGSVSCADGALHVTSGASEEE